MLKHGSVDVVQEITALRSLEMFNLTMLMSSFISLYYALLRMPF